MTTQLATLIAAVFAAIAAIFAALLSSRTARRVVQETAQAQSAREIAAARREHLGHLKDTILESALALQTLKSCCDYVPWLAKTPLAEIQERGSTAIARLNYAAQELVAMRAVDSHQLATVTGLAYSFMSYMGETFLYREQIDLGNVALSGDAKEPAAKVRDWSIEGSKKWQARLDELRTLTAELRASL